MNPSSSAAVQAGESALPATGGAAPDQPTIPGLTPPTHRGGTKRRIGEVIVELGFADAERVEAAVSQAREAGKTTGQMLIDSGVLDSNQLSIAAPPRSSRAPLPSATTPFRSPSWARRPCSWPPPTRPTSSRSTTSR
jgi:hypothetical protein